MGYASEIFEENSGVPNKLESGHSYAAEIFDVERNWEKTDEISAITAKPIQKFTGEGGEGADFTTHLKQGFVDEPINKVKIYAESRFPNLSEEERMGRYKQQDGEIIFKSDNGKWYSETPDLPGAKLKRSGAELMANAPAIVGATAGELTGGPVTAGILGGAGEAVRRGIGHYAFGEEWTTGEYLKSVGIEGGLSAVGSIPGRAALKAARRIGGLGGGLKGSRIAGAIGKESIDFKKAAKAQRFYKDKFGVDLFDAQTTESRRLLDKINLYADLPESADLIRHAKAIQDEQAFKAVDKFWDTIGSGKRSASEVGSDLSEAARSSIERDRMRMIGKAKPYYDRAFAKNTEINIIPQLTELDGIIRNSLETGPRRKKLEQFRRMLLRTETINKKEVLVPESRIRQLDELKKTVDTFLKPGPGDTPIDNATKRDIRGIKDSILERLDKANPDYQKARQIWAGDAKAFDKLTDKTRLKSLADLKGDKNFVPAVNELFSSVRNDEKMMIKLRDRMITESPEMWDEILRTRLEGVFDSVKKSAEGGAANSAKLFNSFYRNTVGDTKQNKLIAAAMGGENSAQYKNFVDFTDMLRKVGLISRKESTTATRQESIKAEKATGLLMTAARVHSYPLFTWKKAVLDRLTDFRTARGKRLLAEALVDTNTKGQILRIKRFGPNTEKGLEATSTFLSLVLGGEYRRHGTSLIDYEEE